MRHPLPPRMPPLTTAIPVVCVPGGCGRILMRPSQRFPRALRDFPTGCGSLRQDLR